MLCQSKVICKQLEQVIMSAFKSNLHNAISISYLIQLNVAYLRTD